MREERLREIISGWRQGDRRLGGHQAAVGQDVGGADQLREEDRRPRASQHQGHPHHQQQQQVTTTTTTPSWVLSWQILICQY